MTDDADLSAGGSSRPDPFVEHRGLLLTVAYELLGTMSDAEDVVQDAWLRWRDVDQSTIRDPRAYAVRIVTRVALNQLRTLSRRRESYVGPWLPEPIATSPDVAEDVLLGESLSMALLVVLDSLTPTERAVFLLHEIFGFGHQEIAEMVAKSAPAVRQIAHRARSHVQARRPRSTSDPAQLTAVTDAFAGAARTGDVSDLLGVIAPDVILYTDGGGQRAAALHPIVGLDKVVRFMLAVRLEEATVRVQQVNGQPFVLIHGPDGVIDSAVGLQLEDGLISQIYAVRNPRKLEALDQTWALSRH